jgi:hypothetical protein
MTQVVFLHVGQDIKPATILVRSIRGHHPNAKIIQCSDQGSPEIADVDTVERFDGDITKLMIFRLQSFAAVTIVGPTWFLDTDMICIRPLPNNILTRNGVAVCSRQSNSNDLFNHNFRGINFTEYRGMTFGAVYPFLACTTLLSEPTFWNECLNNLLQLDPKFHLWYGDQEAIRNVVNEKRFSVSLLPESLYACPPEFEDTSLPPNIIHFKGARKARMFDRAMRLGLLAGRI